MRVKPFVRVKGEDIAFLIGGGAVLGAVLMSLAIPAAEACWRFGWFTWWTH